jgi:hypothetical protein
MRLAIRLKELPEPLEHRRQDDAALIQRTRPGKKMGAENPEGEKTP